MENDNGHAMQFPDKKLTLPALQKHFYKALVIAIATVIVLNIGTVVGFYYNTKSDIKINTSDIIDLKKICSQNAQSIQDLTKQVEENITPLSVNSVEITNLEKRMDRFEDNQKRLEDKMDKVIELQIKK